MASSVTTGSPVSTDVPGAASQRQDPARHRRDELDRAAPAGGRGRTRGPIDIRWRGDPECGAPTGEVDMDRPTDDRRGSKRRRGSAAGSSRTVRTCSSAISRTDGAALRRNPPTHGPEAGSSPRASSSAPAAAQAASGIAVRAVQSSGGQIRSRVSVRASPSRTTGSRTSQRRNRRFVVSPRTTVPSRAVGQAVERLGAIPTMRDDLGEHRVEATADLVSLGDAGIDPDTGAAGPAQALDAAGRRKEPALGILGVQPDLDRMALGTDAVLLDGRGVPRPRSGAGRRRDRDRSPARSRDARPGAGCSSRGT